VPSSPFHQGLGIDEILEAVVQRIPPPKDNRGQPLRALIFDSYYDSYKASGAPPLRRWAPIAPCLLPSRT
jgi:translation elongation factor EF-4